MKNIFVYVQHLLGIGHLHRTALITKALARGGFNVTVVSGGMPEASVDFGQVSLIQLPPIKTDAEFKALYDQNGLEIDDKFKNSRKNRLIELVDQSNPDLVLVETYPFGRRQMRFEILPMLDLLKSKNENRPLIASSIRDIIQPKTNPKRILEIIKIVSEYFDYIFVHGDESFIEFEHTFPDAIAFKEKLVYTGYVVKHFHPGSEIRRKKNYVLVSAGGGAVGEHLYKSVMAAAKTSLGREYHWHLLVGNNYSQEEFEKLSLNQTKNLKIERNRDDFLQLLSQCSISISQAGYNTMMDLLVTQTPAVVIPFEGVAEAEQLIRATAFEQQGIVKVVREKNLSPSMLLKAMALINNRDFNQLQIKMSGAEHMFEFIKQK